MVIDQQIDTTALKVSENEELKVQQNLEPEDKK